LLSSSSGERSETGGPSGAEGDLFNRDAGSVFVRDSFALSRAAGSPGLCRKSGLPEDDEREDVSRITATL
jgi:hypothetical protein